MMDCLWSCDGIQLITMTQIQSNDIIKCHFRWWRIWWSLSHWWITWICIKRPRNWSASGRTRSKMIENFGYFLGKLSIIHGFITLSGPYNLLSYSNQGDGNQLTRPDVLVSIAVSHKCKTYTESEWDTSKDGKTFNDYQEQNQKRQHAMRPANNWSIDMQNAQPSKKKNNSTIDMSHISRIPRTESSMHHLEGCMTEGHRDDYEVSKTQTGDKLMAMQHLEQLSLLKRSEGYHKDKEAMLANISLETVNLEHKSAEWYQRGTSCRFPTMNKLTRSDDNGYLEKIAKMLLKFSVEEHVSTLKYKSKLKSQLCDSCIISGPPIALIRISRPLNREQMSNFQTKSRVMGMTPELAAMIAYSWQTALSWCRLFLEFSLTVMKTPFIQHQLSPPNGTWIPHNHHSISCLLNQTILGHLLDKARILCIIFKN